MDEKLMILTLFVAYLFTVVALIAYGIGKNRGYEEFRAYQKWWLEVGKIYEVGEDGRLRPYADDRNCLDEVSE